MKIYNPNLTIRKFFFVRQLLQFQLNLKVKFNIKFSFKRGAFFAFYGTYAGGGGKNQSN